MSEGPHENMGGNAAPRIGANWHGSLRGLPIQDYLVSARIR
jgi:hypothetical protein